MALSTLTHEYDACTTCQAMEQELASLRTALIDPGFGLPVAGETLRQCIARRDDGQRFDAYKADVDDLKCLNTATGSQERTDALLRPAWEVRRGDMVISGKTDAGDGLIFIFPADQGPKAIGRIVEDLRNAPMLPLERHAFAAAVCRKQYGPFVGALRYTAYRLGWAMRDWPSLTIAPFEGVLGRDLERVFYEDRAIFAAKRAGQRGQIL